MIFFDPAPAPPTDEATLVARLRDPDWGSRADDFRSACSMALLVSYDRGITRDWMFDLLLTCESINREVSAIERAMTLREALKLLDKGGRRRTFDTPPAALPDRIENEIHQLFTTLMHHRRALADRIDFMRQCPGPNDRVC